MKRKKKLTAFLLTLVMLVTAMVPSGFVFAGIPTDKATAEQDALWEDAIQNVYATSTGGIDGGNVWRTDLGLEPWDGNLNGTPITTPTETISNDQGGEVAAYVVRNANELRWAMANANINSAAGIPGIKIVGDIDLAGYNDTNWDSVDITTGVVIDGGDHTIWNMSIDYTKTDGANDGFIGKVSHADFFIHKLTISNAYCEFAAAAGWRAGGSAPLIGNMVDGYVSNCYVMNTGIKGAYLSSGFISGSDDYGSLKTIQNSGTKNVRLYSTTARNGCVSGFFEAGSYAEILNSFAVDGTIITGGGHSGGFISCTNELTLKNCFTNVDVYGAAATGSFSGPTHNGNFVFENCYSSGKIEGSSDIGGFLAGNSPMVEYTTTITNCYSTSMVGMGNGGINMGSFVGRIRENTTISSSYAAGETGSLDTNLNNPASVGGFMGVSGPGTLTDNYYDKQTTAMREWASGNAKTVTGVTGLLSTDSEKGGAGLASADAPIFSTSPAYICQDGQYPELAVFVNAEESVWGEYTDLVKAYSKASVQTVLLENYDQGYDEQPLGTDVYDTVRDITGKFKLSDGGSWTKGIKKSDGSYQTETTVVNGKEYDVLTMEEINGKQWITDFAPGIEWSRVESIANENVGFRNLRLCPTINLDPGNGQSVIAGDKYDHRPNVSLAYTLAAELAQDNLLFEGSFNEATDSSLVLNASAASGLDAVTGEAGNKFHVLIYDFESGEISPDASFTVEELKDKTQNPTEVSVPGELDKMYTGVDAISNAQNGFHFVEYIWTLPDGRYVRNGKMITAKDTTFNISANAVKDVTQSPTGSNLDSDSVMLGVAEGAAADVSNDRISNVQTEVEYGKSATISWEIPSDKEGKEAFELAAASIKTGTDYTEWRIGQYNKDENQLEAISYDYSIEKNTATGKYDIVAKEIKRVYPIVKNGNTYSVTFDFQNDLYHDTENDLELNLQFARSNVYTVKYDTQGGSTLADKTDLNYTDANLLPTGGISKDGFTFLGWKYGDTTVTDTNTYDSLAKEDTVTSITLVAQWKENVYQVKYETGFEDVTVADKGNVKWNDSNLLPELPKIEGYGFIGWELNGKLVTATDKYSELTTDQTDGSFITLVAKWEELADYSVLYNTNGGAMPTDTPSKITGMKYKDTVPTPTPVRDGFTFKGWTYKDVAVADGTSYNALAKDDTVTSITLVAQWKENVYQVKYETGFEDVTIADKGNVKWNDSNLLPELPKKDGYGLIGWELNGKLVTATDKYSELTTNQTDGSFITLVAKWEELADYSVLYNTNGGAMPTDTPSKITGMKYKDTVPTPTPVREGFTFKGWTYKDVAVADGTSYNALANDDTVKELELVAQWEINKFTIDYDFVSNKNPGGITVPDGVILEYGATADEPKFIVLENWTFDGWYTDQECEQKYDFTAPIKNDMTLYGKWTHEAPDKPVEPTDPTDPTDPRDPGDPIGPSKPSSDAKPSTPSTASSVSDSGKEIPKTGDTPELAYYLALAGISACVVLLLVQKRKKQYDL